MTDRPQWHAVGLLMAFTLLAQPRDLIADEPPEIRVGFDGSFKVGVWTPIHVDFGVAPVDSATCNVIVPDADGNPTIAPLAHVSDGRYAGVFRSGRLTAPIRVQSGTTTHTLAPFEDGADGDAAGPAVRPARQSVKFLGVVGFAGMIERTVKEANESESAGDVGSERARLIEFPDWNALPASGPGWDALDVLFVAETFPENDQQNAALRDWVRRGGHLVLAVGGRSDAFQSSPLAEWLPARVDGSRNVVDLAIVVDRVPGAPALPVRGGVVAARLDAAQGQVLLSTFEGPLAARFAYGIGRVTVFALDYQAPPMDEWDGTPEILLDFADVDLDAGEGESQLRTSGLTDLATQLAAGLDWFPDAAKPSYGTILAAMLCFLLIAGPLDYFLVHRLWKRPRRTWLTFPAAVLVAAGCGAVVASRAHPTQTLVNQLEVIDVDAALSTIRVRNWSTLYSPSPERRDVEFTAMPWIAGDANVDTRVTWFGKPETGFRGMYRAGGLDLGNPEYEFAPDYRMIHNLPIDQWSTKSLSAEWEQQPGALPVQSSLADDGTEKLTGSLTHHFAAPITDWMLAYGDYVYFAGSDSPDSEVSIAPGVPLEPAEVLPVPRILQRVLVGYHNVVINRGDTPGGHTTTPSRRIYDPLDRDPLGLVRTITFHEAAGGRSYTGLANASLARSDLSRLLPLQRAVLLGRVAGPALHCAAGNDDDVVESSTFIRIILPVEPASSAGGSIGAGNPLRD